ncbi:Cys/Met metabolism PLP-dependent enzyme-domain-containing protein [Hypoxylon crocopeplum]|nr:Cys/Met metabolism PLP-dependent enzyme-domain-containing protein [Hypoxylon crocopeplum]
MAPRFETLRLHAGQKTDPTTRSRAVPIYQTGYFNFDNSAQAARCFSLEEPGHIGTRTSNPTTAVLEERIAALEGGIAAVAVASGQSAVFMTMLCLAEKGENIVSTSNMYHGAYNQFTFLLPSLGITAKVVQETPENIEKAIDDNTRAVYIETMGHPAMNIPDIEAIAKVAHSHGVPLVVDNTAGAGGYWCQPISHGADIVTHSASKWICGHGTSVGGVVIDSGRFDWSSPRFAKLNKPNPGFHNINFWESFGPLAFTHRFTQQILRDTGSCLSPYNSRELLLGLETLSLRCERHSQNAEQLAAWLRGHASVSWVDYPGLVGSPSYNLVKKYLPRGAGATILFGIKGGAAAGEAVVDGFKLITHMAAFGDAKSAATHPWSSTHKPMYAQEKIDLGVTEDMIRISVGIEHIEDLKEDMQQSFDACPHVPKP